MPAYIGLPHVRVPREPIPLYGFGWVAAYDRI